MVKNSLGAQFGGVTGAALPPVTVRGRDVRARLRRCSS